MLNEHSVDPRRGVDDGSRFPRGGRLLRAGIVGGGRISKVQAMGMRLSDRWEIVAGAFSSDPQRAGANAAAWRIDPERSYSSFEEMSRREAARVDGIDAVVICTPNHLHYPVAKAFLQAGIDVICDKPLANTLEEAAELVEITRRSGLVFGVTYVYSAYPMVRQARSMIAAGAIGRVRQVHVEYVQEYMSDASVSELAHIAWRHDPELGARTACACDIGTHACHLASFASGLRLERLSGELLVCGPAKRLDDTIIVATRYQDDVPGTLWATQVAPGNFVGLRLRIFGDRGGIEWDHENPDVLAVNLFGQPTQLYRRGFGGGLDPAAEQLTRIARGATEGWIEAWANLFLEFGVSIGARRGLHDLPPDLVAHPTVEDGARGIAFVEALIRSSEKQGSWVDVIPYSW